MRYFLLVSALTSVNSSVETTLLLAGVFFNDSLTASTSRGTIDFLADFLLGVFSVLFEGPRVDRLVSP